MEKDKQRFLKNLGKKGISKKIIKHFDSINREDFFDPHFRQQIYSDKLIPVGSGEKSDDPYILAKMLELLNPHKSWRILEVGTGSGYSTALLSQMAKEVVTIEYHEKIAKSTKEKLINLGFFNIRFFAGDATEVSEKLGNFDAVIVFAACLQRPFGLLTPLKSNGVAVFPMGPAFQQQISLYKNITHLNMDDSLRHITFHDMCTFPSIRGKYGWIDQPDIIEEAEMQDEEGKTDQ